MHFSVVVPVYDEQDSLPLLYGELVTVLERLGRSFELIFVDDSSQDHSPQVLSRLREQRPDIVRVIRLSQHCGQTRAMREGLQEARGEVVITLDADLQNDPADIPVLAAKLQGEWDVVCGWRKLRQDKRLKALLSRTGNVFLRLMSGLKIHDVSCTLRAYRRDCVKDIPLAREGQHRFIPLSLFLQGYRVSEILCHHRPRRFGDSKYGHRRVFKVLIDLIRILAAKGRA